jgi:hypothetical protein
MLTASNDVGCSASVFRSFYPRWLASGFCDDLQQVSQLLNADTKIACTVDWLVSVGRSVGRSATLLLGFASTIISGFSLSRSIIKIFVLSYTCTCLEMGPPLWRGRGRSFCVGATFVTPYFQHDIRTVTIVQVTMWLLCTLWHCTTLSNIYIR